MKSKRKFCRQSCSKNFDTFWWLSKFSFHHKWNDAWLLEINCYIRVASGVAKRLKLRKLGNIKKIFKLHRIIAQCLLAPSPPKIEIPPALAKIPWKTEIERSALLHFVNDCRFNTNILQNLQVYSYISIFSRHF